MPVDFKRMHARAKRLRKAHPKTKYSDLLKKAAAEISGTGKCKPSVAGKKVSGVKKVAGVKKVSGVKKPASVKGSVKRSSAISGMAQIKKAEKISNDIDKLEAKRSVFVKGKKKDLVHIVERQINALHDKLDVLKK